MMDERMEHGVNNDIIAPTSAQLKMHKEFLDRKGKNGGRWRWRTEEKRADGTKIEMRSNDVTVTVTQLE